MKNFFNNLRLGKKMLLSPMIVFIFLFVIGYFTFTGLYDLKASQDDIFNSRFRGYQNSARILIDLSNVQADLYKLLNWVGTGREAKDVEELSNREIAVMAADIQIVKKILSAPGLSAEEKRTCQGALENLMDYQKATLKVLEMAPKYGGSDFLPTAEEKFASASLLLNNLLALEEKLSREKYAASVASFNVTMTLFLAIFVIAVVVSFLTSVLITRMVLKPIRETIDVVSRFAEGDLTQSIELDAKDEIGDLVNSVNLMREKMGEAVGQALQVSSLLSDSASEEAASIEETSASLDEIASMTRQNAANTSEANQLMISAKDAIKKANDSMTELTRSMKEITGASEQTQKIVKSIDEIAFQTNLLALNAAVEAARAGEAGAGFAVVADEVRNLAMRATESARNSSNLIEDIVRKVKSGESLVGVTSTAFNQVTTSSEKVVELMGEIAAASQEQSQGIDQVNTAIAGMNTTTQQNAGNAEKLASIMSMFRTQSHGGDARPEKEPARQAFFEKPKFLPAGQKIVKPEEVIPLDRDAFS